MPRPNLSILTSFSVLGLQDSCMHLNTIGVRYVELYAFMQKDLPWLISLNEQGRHCKNVVEYLSEAFNQEDRLNEICDAVCSYLGELRLCGVSTFIPEIMAHANYPIAQQTAERALCFLVDFVAEMNERGHPVQTLELVCGSALDGVWRARHYQGGDAFVVNRLLPLEAIQRLLSRLVPVATRAASKQPKVVLALEMEPGPLFTVNGDETIRAICSEINRHPNRAIRDCMGLNLDIPHWCFIEGIQPKFLLEQFDVQNRIVHAHISDHTIGHFADAPISSFHPSDDFGQWLSILDRLPARGETTNPGYSGFLTIELECCRDITSVETSIAELENLMAEYWTESKA